MGYNYKMGVYILNMSCIINMIYWAPGQLSVEDTGAGRDAEDQTVCVGCLAVSPLSLRSQVLPD